MTLAHHPHRYRMEHLKEHGETAREEERKLRDLKKEMTRPGGIKSRRNFHGVPPHESTAEGSGNPSSPPPSVASDLSLPSTGGKGGLSPI